MRRAIAVDRPPPFGQERVATDFFTLADTATSPFFAKSARHRLVILLSDGESSSFAVSTLVELLGARHVSLLVVRLWHPDEAKQP